MVWYPTYPFDIDINVYSLIGEGVMVVGLKSTQESNLDQIGHLINLRVTMTTVSSQPLSPNLIIHRQVLWDGQRSGLGRLYAYEKSVGTQSLPPTLFPSNPLHQQSRTIAYLSIVSYTMFNMSVPDMGPTLT